MDDGSRSPSPFEEREVVIHTTSIRYKLIEVKCMEKTIRPRGNIVSLFSGDEVITFSQITSGIRDPSGKRIFIPMRDMSDSELRIAYTGETTEPNDIFI